MLKRTPQAFAATVGARAAGRHLTTRWCAIDHQRRDDALMTFLKGFGAASLAALVLPRLW
jgi:hypothetical protein